MGLITLVDREERLKRMLEGAGLKPDWSPEDSVTDLLADLRHLCDFVDLDFEALVERSLMHYEAEVEELQSALAEEEDGDGAN
jgi:hypothetical protein